MFIPVKKIKKWFVVPITGKTTFKVIEQTFLLKKHVSFKGVTKEEPLSQKTVLTDKPKDEAERFVYMKENNLK